MQEGQGRESIEEAVNRLIDEAASVKKNAYAPYSNFMVGVSIIGGNEKLYTGCNIETVGFNNSLHAEMVAIGKMVSDGCQAIKQVVVLTDAEAPVFPCGFCRQYLFEFTLNADVWAVTTNKWQWKKRTLAELLPDTFRKEDVIDG